MNDLARQKLVELVARFGTSLAEEPQRTEALLRDLCGELRREIFVLVAGLKERVAVDLLAKGGAPVELRVRQLTQRLADNLALSDDAAHWAVVSWATALGVMTVATVIVDVEPEPEPEPPPRAAPALPSSFGGANVQTHNQPNAQPYQMHNTGNAQSHNLPSRPVDSAPRSTQRLDAAMPGVETLIVSKMGRGQFTTINRAIQSASPGARILVKPGHYVEGLIIDRPVEIIGDGGLDEIIVDCSDADVIAMVADQAVVRGLTLRGRAAMKGKEFFAVDIPRGRLLLEGCDISSDSLACVAVHGPAASPILRDCLLRDGKQAGLMVYEGAEATVEDCEFVNNAVGIVTIGGGNPTVRRARIHDGKTGIYAYDGGRGTFEDCAIFAHAITEVQIRRDGNPTLRGCRIRDGKSFGVYVYERGQGLLEDCDIFGCANAGVVIFQAGNPTLRACTIRDGAAEGVYVFDDGRGLVEDCDIFGHRHAGVVVLQAGAPTVHRCRIHDGESVGVYVADNGRGTFARCEIFANATGGIDVEKGGDPTIQGGVVRDNIGKGIDVRNQGRGNFESVEVRGHSLAGVRVTSGGFPVFRRCRIHGQRLRGVLVDESGAGMFEECELSDNGSVGVEITGGGDPVVRASRIQRNQAYGVFVYTGGAGTVEDCDLAGNALGAFDVGPGCVLRRSNNRG